LHANLNTKIFKMKTFSIINFVVFQLCWLLAATYQQQAVFYIVGLLSIHFLLSPTKLADLEILVIALVGIVIDQLLIILHVIQLPENATTPATIPLWLMLLWCSFSWCFNHSLQWLNKLTQTQLAVLGAVFGTLSYTAALQLNVFNSVLPTLYFVAVLAIIWALLLPFLVQMSLLISNE